MNRRLTLTSAMLLIVFVGQLQALDYPATTLGETIGWVHDQRLVLTNRVLDAGWTLDSGRITAAVLTNRHTDQTLRVKAGHVPRIVLDDGRIVDLATLTPVHPTHIENNALLAAPAAADDYTEMGGGPVKVFLLVGQSNMNGRGNIATLKLPTAYRRSTARYADLLPTFGDLWACC